MANKSFSFTLKTLFIFLLLIFNFGLGFAQNLQDENESSSFVTEDEFGNQIIVQKLVWQADEYALSFLVEVQKQTDDGNFEQIASFETEQNFCELSLGYGTYRYKIAVYNFLRQLEYEGEWIKFEIVRAWDPEITNISPKTIYLEENFDGIFSFTGKNLLADSEYQMIPANNEPFLGDLIESDSKDTKVDVQFPIEKLVPGNYSFRVTNMGGLHTEQGLVNIQFKKLYDFDVYGGYTCLINTFDKTLKTLMNGSIWPISAMAGITVIPFKQTYGYFGFGLVGTYTQQQNQQQNYLITGNFFTGHLNFVFQKPIIRGRLVLDLHCGAGINLMHNYIFHFPNGIKSNPPFTSLGISLDAGAGLQVYITKRLYTELRVSTTLAMFNDMDVNMIMPAILIGWQF